MTPGVRPIVIGNWKMNGQRDDLPTIKAIAEAVEGTTNGAADVALCPPATLLYVATTLTEDVDLAIGGQDCHAERKGAHTGDVSAEMLRDCFAELCIVGHSERRADHGETDEAVNAKAAACHRAGLTAIICIGETEEENAAGRTREVLSRQLRSSLPDGATAANTIIAYEPVWAIGTGHTPSDGEIAETHAFLRSQLGARGATMRVLYGGSVKPTNAADILMIANVDGALVGGASLGAEDFLGICSAYAGLSRENPPPPQQGNV